MKQGFMTFSQTCPVCQGTGSSAADACKSCRGNGYEEVKETVTVQIPKGVDTGNRLRVSGKGNIGKKGNRGDLYVTFEVQQDKHFIRDDNDVYTDTHDFANYFNVLQMSEIIEAYPNPLLLRLFGQSLD